MERCDFSSVITIIRNYISESREINQTDLLYNLFDAFTKEEENKDYVFDNGLVCRWIKGIANISPQIIMYYTDDNNQKCLSADIENNILPLMYDSDMAVQEIFNLVVFDTTISDAKKSELTKHHPFSNSKEKADFLCDVLCFSMERKFIKHATGNKKLMAGSTLSPFVKDLIFGAEAPKPCRYFCGRDKELSELHFMLDEYSKVFLQGIPGIDKSELVKAYAKKYKKEYTNIIYIHYSGSLKADIANLDFADDYNASEPEAERFRRHNRFLRSLKDDSLMIFDNFNTIPTNDALLSDILNYSCRVLFTTRSRFDDYETYTIKELSDDELLGLMGNLFSGANKYQTILREIIQTVHGHTFAVELAARLLEVGLLKPKKLLKKLKKEKASMDSEDKISAKKDGKSKKATYYNHIHTLFSLYKLSKPETDIMRNLALAPCNGISSNIFTLLLNLNNLNFINDLIERGFVQPLSGRKIVLHPMIREIAIDETKPSVRSCSTLLNTIQFICRLHGKDITYYNDLFDLVESIMELIINDDMNAYLLFLENAYPYMENYHSVRHMRKVLDEMTLLLANESIGTVSDRALLLDFRAYLEEDTITAIQYEKQALDLIEEINADNAQLVSNLYANIAANFREIGDKQLAMRYMKKCIDITHQYSLVTHDGIPRVYTYALLLAETGQPQEALELLKMLCQLIAENQSDKSMDYGATLEVMGTVCLYMKNPTQAEIYYRKALDIYELRLESDPVQIEEKRREMALFLQVVHIMNQ